MIYSRGQKYEIPIQLDTKTIRPTTKDTNNKPHTCSPELYIKMIAEYTERMNQWLPKEKEYAIELSPGWKKVQTFIDTLLYPIREHKLWPESGYEKVINFQQRHPEIYNWNNQHWLLDPYNAMVSIFTNQGEWIAHHQFSQSLIDVFAMTFEDGIVYAIDKSGSHICSIRFEAITKSV